MTKFVKYEQFRAEFEHLFTAQYSISIRAPFVLEVTYQEYRDGYGYPTIPPEEDCSRSFTMPTKNIQTAILRLADEFFALFRDAAEDMPGELSAIMSQIYRFRPCRHQTDSAFLARTIADFGAIGAILRESSNECLKIGESIFAMIAKIIQLLTDISRAIKKRAYTGVRRNLYNYA